MTALTESRLETPVGEIQVFRGGEGEPLVYLHSAGGESTNPALEQLAESYDVIVPIFPGFGESEGIEHIDSMDDALFHLRDVRDRLELRTPIVVGLSLGGWMAAELATRYPMGVGKLVLINPVGLYIEGAPIAEMFGRTPGELAELLFADQAHPMAVLMHSMGEFAGDVGKLVDVPMELILPMWRSVSATAKLGWDPYLHNPKLRERLWRISAPTLVVRGVQDRFLPDAHAKTYASEIPDAQYVEIDGAAHWLPFERPNELVAALQDFLGAAG